MNKHASERGNLVQFFALTFTISWLLWLPSVIRSTWMDGWPEVVGLPGMFAVFGPAIAAIGVYLSPA